MKQHRITVEKTARYFTTGDDAQAEHVVFACHGYAQLADEFLATIEPLVPAGTLIVAPEGLHRFYPRGSSGKVAASWMTKEERLDDIRDYVAYLDDVYAEVMKKFPGAKTTALGFSQGAATASRWASLGKSHLDELILFCGFFPPDLPPAGIPHHISLTVVTASNDKFISPEEEEKQLELMKKISPVFTHLRFEGEHTIDPVVMKKLLEGK